jgi:hypothetical protein
MGKWYKILLYRYLYFLVSLVDLKFTVLHQIFTLEQIKNLVIILPRSNIEG